MLAMLLCVTGTRAHHSIAGEYDATRQLTVEGIVNVSRFVNPYPFVEMDVTDRASRTQHWRLEMHNRRELAAVGMTADTLKPGDRVIVIGSASRTQPGTAPLRAQPRNARLASSRLVRRELARCCS